MTDEEIDKFLEKAHYELWLIHLAEERVRSLEEARKK